METDGEQGNSIKNRNMYKAGAKSWIDVIRAYFVWRCIQIERIPELRIEFNENEIQVVRRQTTNKE